MNPIAHPKSSKRTFLSVAVVALSVYPALFLGLGGPAAAQEQASKLDRPLVVSFDGKDVALEDVLQSFAQQVQAQLDLAPEVHGQLSLKLSRARLESVMNDLCTAYRCSWELNAEPTRELVVRPQGDE
jgi:hypothetical protein